MKAYRVYADKVLKLEEMPSQPVSEGCVKLKISCAAVSVTDALIYEGKLNSDKLPLIIGRQGVGMVTETGENVTNLVRGDRVAVDPYVYCGTCAGCKSGKTLECEKMLTYGMDEDGFLRDFAVVNASGVCKIPERIKDGEAVFLEHIAMALNAFAKLDIEKGEHLVIVGANVTGIILAQIAIYHQAVPIVVDSRQDRLDIAESLGVYYTVNCVDTDVQKKIFSLTGGRMAETVAFMTQTQMPVPISKSLDYAARGAKFVLVGWKGLGEDMNVSLTSALNKQLALFFVNNGAKQMQSAINLLVNKTVNVVPLISKEAPFDNVDEVLQDFCSFPERYIKVIIKMQ